jgi:hypothetical protein
MKHSFYLPFQLKLIAQQLRAKELHSFVAELLRTRDRVDLVSVQIPFSSISVIAAVRYKL